MKNSFSKNYERIDHPVGKVEFKFKSRMSNAHGLIVALTLPIFIPSCTVTMGSTYAVMGDSESSVVAGMVLGVIVGIAATAGVINLIVGRRESIFVTPGKGLAFKNNKTLPFSEVKNFGITRKRITGQGTVQQNHSQIYAESGGREIPLTGDLPDALANALLDEILALR